MNVTVVDWAVLLGLVLILFAVDLLAATLRPHAVGPAEAALWSVFFVAVAAGFGAALGALEGWGYAGQFFAGYVVEKSLSVDNLFVFAIVMSSFAVPREHQQRVLIFGLVLIWTAVRLLTHRDDSPGTPGLPLAGFIRRFLPVTDAYDGGRLITRAGRRRAVTPPFIVFAANALALLGLRALYFLITGLLAVIGGVLAVTAAASLIAARRRQPCSGPA